MISVSSNKAKGATFAILFVAVILCIGCGKEKTPPRDQIPVLRERVFELQQAVKDQNNRAIDSLLSIKIQSHQQTSDSLLNLVYGPRRDFAFTQFGACQYNYTHKKALVECYIMDSTSQRNRPILFSWVHEHDMWLLKRFEADSLKMDYGWNEADTLPNIDSATVTE
jgi:hypothetical protein